MTEQQPQALKAIGELDLGRFRRPVIEGYPNRFIRAAWYLVNALVFGSPVLGLLPSSIKRNLLIAFGAKVGPGFVCKPRVNIKNPWFLSVGTSVWIGEGVWIDNLCDVEIGDNVCISQGARLLTGSHDWSDPAFPFFAEPIVIGSEVWITAFREIRPGVTVPGRCVVLRDLSKRDVREWLESSS